MDGLSSFEQLSSTDTSQELNAKQHRIIIADRRNPKASWSTTNQPIERRSFARSLVSVFVSKRSQAKPSVKPTSNLLSNSSNSLMAFNYGPFSSNEWRTSKYTMLNFIPKNLFEQFRRLANFYFLVTALVQILLPFSPVGPFTSLAPLVFVVGVTAIKQAYEDYLRHRSDQEQNNRSCYVLRDKTLTKIRSKDIRVGDFVYVRKNEEIPCDMILLAAGGLNGDRCYITTSNLDGEANLKSRSCSNLKDRIGPIENLNDTMLIVECEHPSATLYEFNGFLRAPVSKKTYDILVMKASQNSGRYEHIESSYGYASSQRIMMNLQRNLAKGSKVDAISSDDIHEIPLDISNLLPRASRLRNTSHIYGLVVYTGRDTKLARNSHVKPNKFSSIERQVNVFLLISFLVLFAITLISTFRYSTPDSWYLAPIVKQDSRAQIFLAHFLLYNYLLPISLYVTLEFVKFFGTISVIDDERMHLSAWKSLPSSSVGPNSPYSNPAQLKPKPDMQKREAQKVQVTDKPKCNSSDLNEELGQIEVLFSDKTGTLTENCMIFTACSVEGKLYRHLGGRLHYQPDLKDQLPPNNVAKEMATLKHGRPALLNAFNRPYNKIGDKEAPKKQTQPMAKVFDHRVYPIANQIKLVDRVQDNERLVGFFITLCLCSTVTINESEPLDKCVEQSAQYNFQSASPDEEALISAAHLYGITMCKSNDHECFIMIRRSNGRTYPQASDNNKSGTFKPLVETKNSNSSFIVRHFKRLMLFEFNSSRKRMSVIYEDCDNNCLIMTCKGSEELLDCVDMKTLDTESEHSINNILAHFEAFSRSGLRTLLVAIRAVSQQEYSFLEVEMKQVKMSIYNRDQLFDKLFRQAERDFQLLGATAVEDSLQEGVPETIASLKDAGIKVWLLTGDKVETAQSVAYLCKLLDPDMTQFHLVRQRDLQACQKLLTNFNEKLAAIKQEDNGKQSSRTKPGKPAMQRFALIADGRSLHYAMRYAQSDLAKLCKSCDIVLGCRLSPLQKAEVVTMIKNDEGKPITAAIGDGANDVSMIQEAHVGIGISGKEGRQAVNCADFGISRFRMLGRLLFVHGHLFHYRASQLILYFFYKNFLFIMPQFFYSFFNLSSAHTLYHAIQLVAYNLFVTSLPILFFGLHEVHIPQQLLQDYPILYRLNRGNANIRLHIFLTWILIATFQAVIIFSLMYYVWGSHRPFLESGKMGNSHAFSIILYFVIVIVVNLKLYFLSRYHSYRFILSIILSILVLPLGLFGYSLLDLSQLLEDNSYYGQIKAYLISPMFWIAIFINTSAAMVPDIIWHVRNEIIHHRRLNLVTHHPSKI